MKYCPSCCYAYHESHLDMLHYFYVQLFPFESSVFAIRRRVCGRSPESAPMPKNWIVV